MTRVDDEVAEPVVSNDWSQRFFGASTSLEIFERLGKFDSTSTDAQSLAEMLALKPGARILDVPCGFGRFAALLVGYGFDVDGLDNSEAMLACAERINPGPQYVLGDMRSPRSGPYDAILNLWTSLGYFASAREDEAALRSWHGALRYGGQLVIEISDLERARLDNPNNEPRTYRRRVINDVVDEVWIDWLTATSVVRYSFRDQEIVARTRIYSAGELLTMLQRAGFEVVGTYGSFKRAPKRPSDRLILCARKPFPSR